MLDLASLPRFDVLNLILENDDYEMENIDTPLTNKSNACNTPGNMSKKRGYDGANTPLSQGIFQKFV